MVSTRTHIRVSESNIITSGRHDINMVGAGLLIRELFEISVIESQNKIQCPSFKNMHLKRDNLQKIRALFQTPGSINHPTMWPANITRLFEEICYRQHSEYLAKFYNVFEETVSANINRIPLTLSLDPFDISIVIYRWVILVGFNLIVLWARGGEAFLTPCPLGNLNEILDK